MQPQLTPTPFCGMVIKEALAGFVQCPCFYYNYFLGMFLVRATLFGLKTQGLCFYYLPNIESTWNKFKWKILNNSNYDNFHGGGDFSHAYVIMHKKFGKKF